MYTWQNPNNMEGEVSLLLDNIARATIDVFHSYTGSGGDLDCMIDFTSGPLNYFHYVMFGAQTTKLQLHCFVNLKF